ncbi:MAG: hypothetical protein HY698_15265 [Deltaproteobacteria bacterium]|nr:hypothetical protein [Deltaproteobacteria bacterium]
MSRAMVACILALLPATEVVAGERKTHVGLHAGVVLPQVSSELKTALGIKLEAGFRAWSKLAPFVQVGYSQPVVESAQPDQRLPAGSYSSTTVQRELSVTAGALWWFRDPSSSWNIYAGVGARMYLLQTITNGEAGESSFLENRETSTRYGAMAAAGLELAVGPGTVVGELEGSGSDLPHLITGDVATTAAAVSVGYRLFF